ncbi:MAG: VWA domain-containing protein [Lachnospiraceae bacterium]|nr:VWA domain-containing protein [Lachnospiraceae bacterium]
MKKRSILKKPWAAILALAMSVSLLTACAGPAEKSADTGTAEDFSVKDSDMSASDMSDNSEAVAGEVDLEGAGDAGTASDTYASEGSEDVSIESTELSEKASSHVEKISTKDRATDETHPAEPKAEAGLLTAGRWNDNNNWGYFTNLVKKDSIAFPSYGLNPCNRIAVTVKNSNGDALPNRTVTLEDTDGKTLWESVSDKTGVAYLFYEDKDKPAKINAIKDDGSAENFAFNADNKDSDKDSDKTGQNGSNNNNGQTNGKTVQVSDNAIEITLDSTPDKHKKMDIMFIMDATGSMTDEMTFLQEDFSKITREAGTDNMRYSVNFYRDEGDDYVTKCFDFSTDVKEIQKNINDQSADGGGDTPEAVSQILDESINSSSWDKDSVKLAFLIFDAPPHTETSDKIYETVKKASKMGVHFIPVVSSNAERDTELFGRALAICTNGEYVFLTDDSGIGDSHLEPIIGDYTVEPLYDIITDIIKEYSDR